jgi:hypothetical protein
MTLSDNAQERIVLCETVRSLVRNQSFYLQQIVGWWCGQRILKECAFVRSKPMILLITLSVASRGKDFRLPFLFIERSQQFTLSSMAEKIVAKRTLFPSTPSPANPLHRVDAVDNCLVAHQNDWWKIQSKLSILLRLLIPLFPLPPLRSSQRHKIR